MRKSPIILALLLVCCWLPAGYAETPVCADPSGGLGVSRIVEIDASNGPLYGDVTKYAHEDTFLGPKEVVLTFDDGPIPWITKSILDTLDKYCTKATFFSVGQMALAYPQYSKEVIARGHTLGAHTWSHPMNLAHLSYEKAKDQIERGFAAVSLAAGQPIAPFFRFPGLNDSDPLLAHLQSRGIASFTVDVISNDSYIANPARLAQRTLAEVEQHKGGIILFHDIKASTTKALPDILKELQARGYKVVHMRAKATMTPVASYEPQLAPVLAKVSARAAAASAGDTAKAGDPVATHQLQPATATAAVSAPDELATASPVDVPVTQLAPAARTRVAALDANTTSAPERVSKHAKKTASNDDSSNAFGLRPVRHRLHQRDVKKASIFPF